MRSCLASVEKEEEDGEAGACTGLEAGARQNVIEDPAKHMVDACSIRMHFLKEHRVSKKNPPKNSAPPAAPYTHTHIHTHNTQIDLGDADSGVKFESAHTLTLSPGSSKILEKRTRSVLLTVLAARYASAAASRSCKPPICARAATY